MTWSQTLRTLELEGPWNLGFLAQLLVQIKKALSTF